MGDPPLKAATPEDEDKIQKGRATILKLSKTPAIALGFPPAATAEEIEAQHACVL
jgi:hypothetical protein